MAIEFIMPQLGLTMTEGTVSKWFKQVGDRIAVGDVIVEISTDKITNQVEATGNGTILDILVQEGEVAPVKAVLAVIGEPGEKVATASRAAAVEAAAAVEVSAAATRQAPVAVTGEWVKASPLARKTARESGINLALVTGTGPDGRVVERDVLAFSEQQAAAPKASPLAAKIAAEHEVALAPLYQGKRIMKDDVLAAITPAVAPAADATKGVPITGMRKVIAERMAESWQTAPHVHHTVEVDMYEATQFKDKLTSMGMKLSFTELIVKAAAKALTEFPMVNNSLIDGMLVTNEAISVGIAVAVDNGLLVPVIRNADHKSLSQLRTEINDLGERARQGKLLPDDYTGGTFTISNLGMYGVDHFTPIINPPESAILGVCRTVERPVVVDGAIAIRPMMNLVLGYDHRLVDGALASRYMARVRQLLEQPLLLI